MLLAKFLKNEVHVMLSDDMYEKLTKAAHEMGTNLSWVMRRATEIYLQKKGYYSDGR